RARRSAREHHRHRHGCARGAHLRHRGAEEAPAPEDLLGRGDLVPDVLRAERGLRRGGPPHPRGARWGRLGRGRAERGGGGGDDWIVNGQKVWTTVAHLAKWGMLLARTNPDVTKHDGLSYFILDMHAPGVEVRPLYQMTGEAEFNEVFFTNVRIPNAMMLGKEGQGWRVAITTLMNERVAIGGGVSKRKGGGVARQLIDLWNGRQKGALTPGQEAVLRDRVTRCYIDIELGRLTAQRARAAQKAGNPGPEGSVNKLAMAEINKHLWETAI